MFFPIIEKLIKNTIKRIIRIPIFLCIFVIGMLLIPVRHINSVFSRQLRLIFGQYYDGFTDFVADNYPIIDYYRLVCYICDELINRLIKASYEYRVNPEDIRDKVVVITDGWSKCGRNITRIMLENGAKVVIIGVRTLSDGPEPSQQFGKMALDMTSLDSVQKFATAVSQLPKHLPIDILIFNSRVLSNTNTREETDRYERHLFANHLGYLITLYLFADKLNASHNARVVIESSACHIFGNIHFDDIQLRNNYTTMKAYCQSKLANVLFAREIAQQNLRTIKSYSVNPGYTESELEWRYNTGLPFIQNLLYMVFYRVCNRTQYSIHTTLFCALDSSVANESGYYYSNCQRVNIDVSDHVVQNLWEKSCKITFIPSDFLINLPDFPLDYKFKYFIQEYKHFLKYKCT